MKKTPLGFQGKSLQGIPGGTLWDGSEGIHKRVLRKTFEGIEI